jgi:phage-related baseplate assembly protein
MTTFPAFPAILANVRNSVNQYSASLVDYGLGRPLYAITNVIADGIEYLQGVCFQILLNTRLSTCDDPSADTFFAQFNFARLPAVASTGIVSFSRFSSSATALVPLGTTVKTADGTVSFTVIQDNANSYFNADQGGYLIPIGVLSVNLPVQAAVAGSASNVQVGTISLISASLPNIDVVTNASGFSNGADQESTASATTRFQAFLNTRSQATQSAVEYAISTVQQNLSYAIVENPSSRAGSFQIFVDDGSGAPSPTLLAAITAAIDPIRPLTVTYTVRPATVVYATVSLTIYAANGYNKATLQPLVANAIDTLINTLGVGNPLAYYDIAAVARNIEGVSRIENLTLNGGTQDVGGGVSDSIHTQTVAVN